eukprot:14795605-Heterocapsa_arctica.AAC.1
MKACADWKDEQLEEATDKSEAEAQEAFTDYDDGSDEYWAKQLEQDAKELKEATAAYAVATARRDAHAE